MKVINYHHKGLERFALTGNPSGINPSHITKVRVLLEALLDAESLREISDPSLHALAKHRPALRDWYGLSVNGNWRLTFRYDRKNNVIKDVDYLDYH